MLRNLFFVNVCIVLNIMKLSISDEQGPSFKLYIKVRHMDLPCVNSSHIPLRKQMSQVQNPRHRNNNKKYCIGLKEQWKGEIGE